MQILEMIFILFFSQSEKFIYFIYKIVNEINEVKMGKIFRMGKKGIIGIEAAIIPIAFVIISAF